MNSNFVQFFGMCLEVPPEVMQEKEKRSYNKSLTKR